ncbi:cation transporter [Sporolactobacillus spathodeae]|uniref:Divalent metal cation (Fe/Co/Zn/Cd) transporter n=1 Tax=Sporolactobacillus spathodeae TaxID=1465502 RepID=A0ABS2Q7C8_9BACL|nr:cation transporter [Sporolactobacillus spathodeae]MBM7657698.1 divalent metal cation (Fe/Co/Zn/Cd) transporter [Sporolactobacillus spathodeae]
MNRSKLIKTGIRLEVLSVLWMAVEWIVAVYSGLAAHSLLLISFGLDSLIEMGSGSVLIWRLRVEARGSDASKVDEAERLSSRLVGWALILLAFYTVVASLAHLLARHTAETSFSGLALAIGSALFMPWLMVRKKQIARAIGSAALAEDAMCNLVCAYMALTVILGTGLTAAFKWWWADSLFALVLVYFIFNEGWEALHPEEEESND